MSKLLNDHRSKGSWSGERIAELADDALIAGNPLECERLIAALYAYYDYAGSIFWREPSELDFLQFLSCAGLCDGPEDVLGGDELEDAID